MGKLKLIFLLMIWCAGALAQSVPNDNGLPAPETTPETTTDAATDDAVERERERQEEARAREAAQKREQEYVPSEEISDDLPAPFPVDI